MEKEQADLLKIEKDENSCLNVLEPVINHLWFGSCYDLEAVGRFIFMLLLGSTDTIKSHTISCLE